MRIFKTFDEVKNREVVVGTLEGETFTKQVTNKHYMVSENGYGIQAEVLDELVEAGCKVIEIHSKKSIWKSHINQWGLNSKSYGHGLQVFLSIHRMEKVK